MDPTIISPCDICNSKADVCTECRICLRCGGDGHDEGCSQEGSEYDAETSMYLNGS